MDNNSNLGQQYINIRQTILNGQVDTAQTMLNEINPPQRTAEWYFLSGSCAYNKGFMNDAYNYYNTAYSLEPQNPEYMQAKNNMEYARGGGMAGSGYSSSDYRRRPATDTDKVCNCCSNLICADCLCECFGGDLIPCC